MKKSCKNEFKLPGGPVKFKDRNPAKDKSDAAFAPSERTPIRLRRQLGGVK